MADFGMGPYAWLRGPESTQPRVGQCIADAVTGFPKEYGGYPKIFNAILQSG